MTENNVLEFTGREEISDPLTELLKSGAQQLIRHAVEAELAEFMSQYSELQTEDGKTLVVRNGHLPERELQTGLGPVKVPKVRSKSGEPVRFQSALVPPYVRKTKSLEAAIPWLYLKGISSGEMGEALKVLVGPDAKGLSASTVSRLKQQWAEEYRNWCNGALDKERWVYRAPLKITCCATVCQYQLTMKPFDQNFCVYHASAGSFFPQSQLQTDSSNKTHGEPAMARRSN